MNGPVKVFESSNRYYQTKHPKVEAISLSALLKDTNKQTCRSRIFRLSLFIAERQAGKLWTPTFKVLWSDSSRESSPKAADLTTRQGAGWTGLGSTVLGEKYRLLFFNISVHLLFGYQLILLEICFHLKTAAMLYDPPFIAVDILYKNNLTFLQEWTPL